MKNGLALKFYTGKTIQKGNWSPTKQLVLSGEENYELINLYLDNWKIELKKLIAEFEAKKIRLNQKDIQDLLNKVMNKNTPESPKEGEISDFISFMDAYIIAKKAKKREIQKLQQTRKLVIIGFNLITKKHLAEWEQLSIKKKSATTLKPDRKLSFEDINLPFIEKFKDFLLNAKYRVKIKGKDVEQNYKINYIDKQIKGLLQFIIAAKDAKLLNEFTWNTIKSEEIEVDSVYTDFDEIQDIYDTQLTHPTELKVRDKYVVNCFLGMRYSDFNKLEPHVFRKRQIKGKEYMVYTGRAQKTDTKVEFALHPIAVAILEKYNYALPKLSAKEFNEILKRVAKKAGLTGLERIREVRGTEKIVKDVPKFELMSSHAGRRSFCTNFYVEGVAIAAIMSISGHSTEKEFRKYIKKTSVKLEVVAEQVSAIKGINHLRVA